MRDKSSIAALASLAICVLVGFAACSPQDEASDGEGTAAGPALLRVSTSASALPMVSLLADAAGKSDPRLNIVILPSTHSSGAVAATRVGEADLGVVTRPLTEQEEGSGLEYLHMARDGLVFATHEAIEVESLSPVQVRGIYSGEIRNWKELGGSDAEIVILDRPEHTSPKMLLRDRLFGPDLAITRDTIVLERPGTMLVSLETLDHSIGYTSLGEILISDARVNVLRLDEVPPTPSNVEEDLYPLVRELGLVVGSPPSREAMRFIDFLYSEPGERIMTSNGYSPTLLNLVIATIPERSVVRQEDRYRPLARHLSQRLGKRVRIRLKHLPAYEMLADEFVAGKTNLAFFGSFTYALARSRTDVLPVARPERDGVSTYRGLILTRKDGKIDDWSDLEGKRLAVIRNTTAGDLFPRVYFKRHGVDDLEAFLGRIDSAGSHDTSILKLLDREVDAAAAKDLVYQQMVQEDPRIRDELKILATSAQVPENALVARASLDSSCFTCHARTKDTEAPGPGHELNEVDLVERLRSELLGLESDPEGRRVLEAFGADRFLPTTHEDYANLYAMIEELGIELSAHRE